MISDSLRKEIMELGRKQDAYKPHKHIALLAALKILKSRDQDSPVVYYDSTFTNLFNNLFEKFKGPGDRNRPYTPFFHLKTTSFWHIIPKSGKEEDIKELSTVGGPTILNDIVSHAKIDERLFSIIKDDKAFKDLEALIHKCLSQHTPSSSSASQSEQGFGELDAGLHPDALPNPFVAYLNSLHSLDAGNENAMAESQACNPYFSSIHVEHPLAQNIIEYLSSRSGRSVILTGHAGDGKSTLALSAYKKLKGLDTSQLLPKPLKPRENLELPEGISLAVIKDLSEWAPEQRDALLDEITKQGLRVLLISNTGALLDTFCEYAKKRSFENIADLRPRLLEAMDAESDNFDFGGAGFRFNNLALHDNLNLARMVFSRMLSPENWTACEKRDCREHCPIYINVQLFRKDDGLAQERVFLAYRRMYEYGTRLTMRQFTAHLAYMLTAGLEYKDISDLMLLPEKPPLSDYLFYNRFFGDNGRGENNAAVQMPVLRSVRSQGFGERPCPAMERHLWLLTHHDKFQTGLPSLVRKELHALRHRGARMPEKDQDNKPTPTPDQAREQARRMLFFLYKDKNSEREKNFLQDFLGSLAILRWVKWQNPNMRLSLEDDSRFRQRVFHVLQEQFTGVRLAEVGGVDHNNLYVTLNRRRQDIRQSAQVVLAQIDFSRDFKLRLTGPEAISYRRDLALIGQGWLKGISLKLNLPFLDYVLARHHGQVGETLQAAYANRLERLKADLITRCRSNDDEEMILVRLRTNHTFLRQHFKVTPEGLEVSNA